MHLASIDALLQALAEFQILDRDRLDQAARLLRPQFAELAPFAQELLDRGWLTTYQFAELVGGRGRGLSLGQYVLLEPIGEGAMGQIWKARRRSDGFIVALKIIRKDRRADANLRRRFLREAQALVRLAHPNIITAIDAKEAASAHYFAMEYVEGINLGRMISALGPLPVAPACDYVRQAALGLQHAHENGLVHRDIGPNNILIQAPNAARAADRVRFGRWGTVKLFDLGLALLERNERSPEEQSQLTRQGLSLGTVDYVAPEQVMDAHRVDIRADLYSLGCTLYEMLTGRPPFPDMSQTRKLLCHQFEQPRPVEELRKGLPPELGTAVRKLMAKDPAQRYPIPAECVTAIIRSMNQLDDAAVAWDWNPFPTDAPEAAESEGSWWKRLMPWKRSQ